MRVRGPEQVILLLCCVITTYCFRPSIIGKRDATQSTSYEPGSSKRVDAGTSIDQPAPRNNINGRYVTERAASQPILRKRVDEDPRLQSRRRIYFVPVQNEGAGDQYEWDQKPRDSHSLNSYQLIRPLLEDSVYVVEGSRGQQFVLKWPDDLTGAEYKAQQRASDPKWRNENIVQLDRCIWQRPSNKRKPKIAKFLIMEYCPHPDLQQMIDDRKYPHTQDLTLFNSRVKEIFMDALNGLELLHKAQVAHLDIKPGNMMMVDADLEKKKSGIEYSVKLGDFGDASLKATETDVRGSPGFAPPGESCEYILRWCLSLPPSYFLSSLSSSRPITSDPGSFAPKYSIAALR